MSHLATGAELGRIRPLHPAGRSRLAAHRSTREPALTQRDEIDRLGKTLDFLARLPPGRAKRGCEAPLDASRSRGKILQTGGPERTRKSAFPGAEVRCEAYHAAHYIWGLQPLQALGLAYQYRLTLMDCRASQGLARRRPGGRLQGQKAARAAACGARAPMAWGPAQAGPHGAWFCGRNASQSRANTGAAKPVLQDGRAARDARKKQANQAPAAIGDGPRPPRARAQKGKSQHPPPRRQAFRTRLCAAAKKQAGPREYPWILAASRSAPDPPPWPLQRLQAPSASVMPSRAMR